MPAPHLVFDVNETLLDLSPLDSVFESLFGDAGLRRTWFASMLHWSVITTLTRQYRDFSTLAGDCLDALAERHGINLSAAARHEVFDTIAHLPPHADVPDALERLAEHGFNLAALTNSAQQSVDTQLANAGLTHFFQHVLSVDVARAFKPHPHAYDVAIEALDADASDLCLIAAHDWDVTGAMRAGLQAVFVARGGAVLNPAGERPALVGRDLGAVADQLIAQTA